MTQTDAILEHLNTAPITPLEALQKYGCFRLAARISDLRHQGYNIISKNVLKDGKQFAEYSLSGGISMQIPADSFKKQSEISY
jgi:hypothetical protein